MNMGTVQSAVQSQSSTYAVMYLRGNTVNARLRDHTGRAVADWFNGLLRDDASRVTNPSSWR